MALAAAIVWEVQTGGNDNNGGGYKTGASGTDYSQATTAQATLTTASTIHTTTTQINVAAGDYTVAAGDVGNVLHVTGGTATAGFYEITVADVPNNRWTVDRAVGTAGQTVAGAMGGCLASPGVIGGVIVTGNITFLKSGTFSITSASTNVSGGCIATAVKATFCGYSTNRTVGNTDTPPVLQLNVASGTIVSGAVAQYINITFDGNSQTTSRGVSAGAAFVSCLFTGFTNSAATSGYFLRCSFTSCSTATVITGTACFQCEAYANTVTPFGNSVNVGCLSYGNTGATTDGFNLGGIVSWHNCTAYNNGRDGFRWSAGSLHVLSNCYAEGNAAFGFNSSARTIILNCGAYNNTSGATTGTIDSVGFITLTASAFTNAAGNDFSLNDAAGGGALLRNAGYPTTFLRGTTPQYLDVGAAQYQQAARATNLRGGFVN